MNRKLIKLRRMLGIGVTLALVGSAGVALAAHSGGNVTLRGYDGQALAAGATDPYSPKQTCSNTTENGLGACHDYDTVTQGYHFQQGFPQVADDYNPDKPFVKSPGMYGKW